MEIMEKEIENQTNSFNPESESAPESVEKEIASNEEDVDMGQLLAQEEALLASQDAPNGPFLTATVVSIMKDGALVDIGLKGEALIPQTELGENVSFKVGDTIQVLRLRSQGDGYVRVSWLAAKEQIGWEEVSEIFKRKIPLQAKIKKEIKGGFSVQCENGITGFLPASQMDVRPVQDAKKWLGQSITAYVLEFDAQKRNLVLSRKQWVSEENQKKRAIALTEIKTGDVRKGTVTGISSFGAFIDLGGVEGLLHIGEIEWGPFPKISKILKVGQTVEVKVIQFDQESGKISLSRKQLLPHPWDGIEAKFPVGAIVPGKVISLTDFGAFVELAKNVDGLLHASEISWKSENVKPKEHLKIGQALDVMILNIQRDQEKIALSLKRAGENPWKTLAQRFPEGSTVDVVVTSLTPFGAFAKMPEEGFEGLIHISDFAWIKRIRHPEDVVKAGDQIKVKVLDIDVKKEKIAFGLKQLTPNPFDQYVKGKKVTGKVTEVSEKGAVVELQPDVEAFVPAHEITFERMDHPESLLKVGDVVEAKITMVEAKQRKISLSIKHYERELQRAAAAKYTRKSAGPMLKDLLS